MDHVITWHDDYVETKTAGDASHEGFLNIVRDILAHPNWRPGMKILADHRELDFSKGLKSYSDAATIASIHVRHKDTLGDVRVALLVKPEVETVFLDLWRTICNYFEFPVDHKIFHDKRAAIHWLESH